MYMEVHYFSKCGTTSFLKFIAAHLILLFIHLFILIFFSNTI